MTLCNLQPTIVFHVIQEGVTTVNPTHTQPFRVIGPFSTQSRSGTYRDLATWTGISSTSPPCLNMGAGLANPRWPIYLPSYNSTAQRQLYNLFSSIVTGESSPFSHSLFMFEGYSMHGVKAVDRASSAYAFRTDDNLLIAPLLQYQPTAALNAQADQLGKQLRQILLDGSVRKELHAYVNYAYGDETPRQWYGHEPWREDRLRALKQKYDPKGRFSFYGPVAW